MTDLSELVEKLEKATGPSRELDGQITLCVGLPTIAADLIWAENGTASWIAYEREPYMRYLANKDRPYLERQRECVTAYHLFTRGSHHAPDYTSSLDAAMTLERDAVERVVLLMSVAMWCRKDGLDPLRHGARLFCIRALSSSRKDGGGEGR